MKTIKILLAALTLIFIASFVNSAQTAQEWERMKKGEVLVSEINVKNPDGTQKTQFLARLYVKAPRQDCWKILRDYNKFSEFMPHLRRCIVLKQEGETFYVRYETKISFKEINYYLKLVGVEKFKRIEYALDKTQKNDIRDATGYWIFDDAPDGSGTILSYSSNIDPGFPAPDAILNQLSKTSLPAIVKNVRSRIESGGTWKKPAGS